VKNRIGFVSNSSTTSFIVFTKGKDLIEETKKYFDIVGGCPGTPAFQFKENEPSLKEFIKCIYTEGVYEDYDLGCMLLSLSSNEDRLKVLEYLSPYYHELFHEILEKYKTTGEHPLLLESIDRNISFKKLQELKENGLPYTY